MELRNLITGIRAAFKGFNPPATDAALAQLRAMFGWLPVEIERLYRDHDGAYEFPRTENSCLLLRMMPVDELVRNHPLLEEFWHAGPNLGRVAWLWTDDESNNVGLYIDGPAKGYLTRLNHDEPILTPAYRSVTSFLSRLLADSLEQATSAMYSGSLYFLSSGLPEVVANPGDLEHDREWVALFQQRSRDEPCPDDARFYTYCAICMTPVEDTLSLTPYLSRDDQWIPERAALLMRMRGMSPEVTELEALARSDRATNRRAALELLLSLKTQEAAGAIDRLRPGLTRDEIRELERREKFPSAIQVLTWP